MIQHQAIVRICINICDRLTKSANDLAQKGFFMKAIHFHEANKLIISNISNENNLLPSDEAKIDELIKLTDHSIEKLKPHCIDQQFPKVINIKSGDKGHSYYTIMKDALDGCIKWAKIYDPYIRSQYQINNFYRVVNVLLNHEKQLTLINLFTGQIPNKKKNINQQIDGLEMIKSFINETNPKVSFDYIFNNDFHDRKILFSNGFVISLGRGLDIFSENSDKEIEDERKPCRETDIYIFQSLSSNI